MLTRLNLSAALFALLSAGACGDDAIVVNDDGISSGGVKLETIEPPRGTILGGNNVLLEGEGLGGNNVVVAFGDAAAEEVVVLSASALLVVAPAGLSPGPVDVVVANAQGFAQRNTGYTYNDPPSVSTVDPPEGPRAGGSTVIINGTGFSELDAGDVEVTFDGEPADAVEVVSDTELSVVTPPGMPQVRADVRVKNANGTGEAVDAYLYVANGLYASAADPTPCRGSSNHAVTSKLVFIDLDDNTVLDIGTDRRNGFTRLASDENGGLVGLEGCTQDLYQIDPQTGETTLLVDTAYDFGIGRHIGGLLRDGNDYIVKNPMALGQLARLSQSTGDITPIGAGPGSSGRRTGFFRDGNRVFMLGSITAGQGFTEVDLASGNEIGGGITVPFTVHSGTLHRGELFLMNRISFGKGGPSDFAMRVLRVDRTTGDAEFVALVPIYLSGLVSGDLR